MPCLATEVPLDKIRSISWLVGSPDGHVKRLAKAIGMEDELETVCRRWEIRRPTKQMKSVVNEIRKKRREEWENLSSHGPRGAYWCKYRGSNGWMRRDVLSDGEQTVALQLRTNTYPTREAMSRSRNGGNVMCQRCGQSVETLGHITGQCLAVKFNRIKRYNKVRGILVSAAQSQTWEAIIEPHIKVDGKTYIPDMVFL